MFSGLGSLSGEGSQRWRRVDPFECGNPPCTNTPYAQAPRGVYLTKESLTQDIFFSQNWIPPHDTL